MIYKKIVHVVSSYLIRDIRMKLYQKLCGSSPIEFFDRKEHSTGNLTNFISAELENIKGASLEQYGMIYFALIAFITGSTFSLLYSWRIGVLFIITAPFTIY